MKSSSLSSELEINRTRWTLDIPATITRSYEADEQPAETSVCHSSAKVPKSIIPSRRSTLSRTGPHTFQEELRKKRGKTMVQVESSLN